MSSEGRPEQSDTGRGYPKGFAEFQILRGRGVSTEEMGFHPEGGRPNFFANRLRIARRFEGISLKGYTESTERGYEGLMQVFLTYTALEKLADCLLQEGSDKTQKQYHLRDRCFHYDQNSINSVWRSLDESYRFTHHVAEHTSNEDLAEKIADLPSQLMPNLALLANGIRNLFAHGHLAPSAKNCDPENVSRICHALSDFLIEVMDDEFCSVVRRFCESNHIDFESLRDG